MNQFQLEQPKLNHRNSDALTFCQSYQLSPTQITRQHIQVAPINSNSLLENYKIKMDSYLQTMNLSTRRGGPSFQGRGPPRPQPPPTSYAPIQQNNPYTNAQYNYQPRQNPIPRPPPPPPVMQTPGGSYRRGRPYDPGYVRQNQREIVDDSNVPNQPFTGGRGGYSNRGRGQPYQQQNFNDNFQPRGRSDSYGQRGRDQQQFNRNFQRNESQRQRQQYQGQPPQNFQRQRSQYRPNYQTNRPQQQNQYQRNPRATNAMSGQRQRNYQPEQREQQYQRSDFPPPPPRGSLRGRGRGMDRGRGRGRGRQMPQAQIKPRQQQNIEIESESREELVRQESSSSQKRYIQSVQESNSYNSAASQSQSAQSVEQERGNQVSQEGPIQEGPIQDEQEEQQEEEGDMQRINDMCSKQQFLQRLQTFSMNNRNKEGGLRLDTGRSFAIFEINKRTNQPDFSLTLKRFRRSTNRAEDQNEKDQTADCPRSKKGLTLTLNHILKQIIDSDGMKARDLAFPMPPAEKKIEFLQIYDFLWNRMRQMIKDVSRLTIKDRDSQAVITICQQMLRFFIIAVKEGRQPHECKLQFDPKMNLESITKILTQLLQIYQNNHYALSKEPDSGAYISPNQPEIMAYAILISHDIQSTLYQKLRLRVNGYGIAHPLLDCVEIKRALEIKKALKMRDYQSFYHILQSDETDYLQACLLIHHLPIVRRQTLKVLQKSCEVQVSTKIRKIPLSTLKKNLRFSNNLNKQFKQFIEQIGLKVVKDQSQIYVILNDFSQSLQDHLSAYAFDFQEDKKSRKFYPKSNRKLNMIDPKIISRQELIKREWYKGSYVEECNSYYNVENSAPVQKIQQKKQIGRDQKLGISTGREQEILQPIKNDKKIEISSPELRKEETKQDTVKNMSFLQQKKKEFARSKFLKALQNMVQVLIRKSDLHSQHLRQCGVYMFVATMQDPAYEVLTLAINNIQQFLTDRAVVSESVKHLQHFARTRTGFKQKFYRSTFQYRNFISSTIFKPLGQIVDYAPSKKENLINQLNLVAQTCNRRKRLKVLVFFVSVPTQFQQIHKSFIKGFVSYLCGGQNSQRNLHILLQDLLRKYTQFDVSIPLLNKTGNIQLQYTFQHFKSEADKSLFFCGFDAAIFIDLYNKSQGLKLIMKKFIENRERVMKQLLGSAPKLQLQIANFVVSTVDKMMIKDNITTQSAQPGQAQPTQLAYSAVLQEKFSQPIKGKFILQQQSLKLTHNLRNTVLQFLILNLQKPQKQKIQVQAIPLTYLIHQIQRNLPYAESLTGAKHISITQFQTYFKENLKCILNAIKRVASNYEIYDWKNILLESSYIKEADENSKLPKVKLLYPQSSKLDFDSLLAKKLLSSYGIASVLYQTNFLQRYQAKMSSYPYWSHYHAVAVVFQEYLNQVSDKQIPEALYLIFEYLTENHCSITREKGKIVGQCKPLILFLLEQLKKLLLDVNVLLPKDFKFKISKNMFLDRPPVQKTKRSPRKAEVDLSKKSEKKEDKVQKKEVEQPQQVISLEKFEYKRQALLDSLLQDLAKENLRNNPQKIVKI